MSRTIFIGDLHGCLKEFWALEKKLKIKNTDTVILLGDLINRGPYSAESIEYIFNSGYACLCGNHDFKYRLDYHNIDNHYYKIYQKISKKAHTWYVNLPFYVENRHYIAVHGGLIPNKKPNKTDEYILSHIRTWDGTGLDLNNPAHPPWYLLYRGTKKIFYGHWAMQGLNLRKNTFGLDTGCVYGGKLTACILETMEIVQVKAKKIYYKY